eukprot:gene13410-biopygen11377
MPIAAGLRVVQRFQRWRGAAEQHRCAGLVAAPDVDLSQEMISQLIVGYSFAAGAATMNADDRMTKALLDIKA